MFGTSKWETCYPQTFEHRPALPTDPIDPIESAPSSFVRIKGGYAPRADPEFPNKNARHRYMCRAFLFAGNDNFFISENTI